MHYGSGHTQRLIQGREPRPLSAEAEEGPSIAGWIDISRCFEAQKPFWPCLQEADNDKECEWSKLKARMAPKVASYKPPVESQCSQQ